MGKGGRFNHQIGVFYPDNFSACFSAFQFFSFSLPIRWDSDGISVSNNRSPSSRCTCAHQGRCVSDMLKTLVKATYLLLCQHDY